MKLCLFETADRNQRKTCHACILQNFLSIVLKNFISSTQNKEINNAKDNVFLGSFSIASTIDIFLPVLIRLTRFEIVYYFDLEEFQTYFNSSLEYHVWIFWEKAFCVCSIFRVICNVENESIMFSSCNFFILMNVSSETKIDGGWAAPSIFLGLVGASWPRPPKSHGKN